MTAITVLNQANVPTGPFTREQVAEKLRTGEFTLDSLAFIEGLSQWTPLREVLAKLDAQLVSAPLLAPPVFTSPSAPPAAAPAYSYAATMQPPTHLVYAGFWLRVWAYLIDALILSIPMMIVTIPLFVVIGGFSAVAAKAQQNSHGHAEMNPAFPLVIIFFELIFIAGITVLGWLYYAYLESGPHQATYGKRVIGLKVTNMAGERISFGHASGRFFGKIITGLIPFAIGYIMAGFTERKQALHDMIASTLVVRK